MIERNVLVDIRDSIISEIDPEQILILDLGPLLLLVIVWDNPMKNFQKRALLRKLLKHIEVPIDIIVHTSVEYENVTTQCSFLTFDVKKRGKLLYKKASDDVEK